MGASFHLLHAGYVNEQGVAGTVSLVRDGDAIIVVDPGMVGDRERDITRPLSDLGVGPDDVTHVFLTHHHPDHALNGGMFPNAAVVDFWATYTADQWTDHPGTGHRPSPNTEILLTPGHTAEDATLLIQTDEGVVACTHLWWRSDRTPDVDPLADDQLALEASRRLVLERADIIVPGHGEPFPANPA